MKRNFFLIRKIIVLSIILIATIFQSAVFAASVKSSPPTVNSGVLDLSLWDMGKDGIVDLSGDWDFYWNTFLTKKDFENLEPKPDIKARVPVVWNAYQINGKSLPGFGHATYRLQVVGTDPGKPMALRIPTMSTAYRMFMDDELIASNGTATWDRNEFKPENRPVTVCIVPETTEFNLIVQVANYVYDRGGMWYSIKMGTPAQIQELTRNVTYLDLFLMGSFFIMGLYYLSIFLLRREDKASLYFVLMCIVAMGRTMIHGDYSIYKILPFINFKMLVVLNYYTVYWAGTTLLLFLRELFPKEISKYSVRGALIYSFSISIITLLSPVWFFTKLKPFMMVAVILTISYGLIFTLVAYFRKRQNSLIVLAGGFVIGVCVLYDVLYHSQLISFELGELTPFGFYIFIFLQSFILARRFAITFRNVNDLSEKLLKLDKLKDEFLANTSHELRTPLNGIIGITEALARGSEGSLNPEQKEKLSIISDSSKRLSNLVNDILDYSKMKYEDIQLNCKAVRINAVVNPTLMILKHSFESDVKLINDIDDKLPPVMADENRFAQIIHNLIGNALKFTKEGYVRISAEQSDKRVLFCVEDSGEGIPQEKYEDIFKSFEQLDTSLTRKHGGTGLGLPITKYLIELQKGEIWVESALGEGSRFYFTLPVAQMQEYGEKEIQLEEPIEVVPDENVNGTVGRTGGNDQILIVDDEKINLQAAAAILNMEGYAVIGANSGLKALDVIRKNEDINLVILDVMMPEMSGYDVCRTIRESKSQFDLPVLMLTAKTNTEDIIIGFEAGANDYLFKPFETEELIARVKTLVSLKKSVAQAMAAESAFLQAQIKPHFLYNTLNTISYFCDVDPQRAEQLINTFANYLRYSFDFEKLETHTSIEKEISLVYSYLEIEKARFGENMEAVIDIDDNLQGLVPPLSIQPLVENAIHHGLRGKGAKGTVMISVHRTEEGIKVVVNDDGIGISSDKLENLLSDYDTEGIGLRNIDLRLRKLYGRGLKIQSETGKGTRIEFTIPTGGESVDTSANC